MFSKPTVEIRIGNQRLNLKKVPPAKEELFFYKKKLFTLLLSLYPIGNTLIFLRKRTRSASCLKNLTPLQIIEICDSFGSDKELSMRILWK